MEYNTDFLYKITPRYISNRAVGRVQEAFINEVGPTFHATLLSFDINVDHFLAQACHETMGLAVFLEIASGDAYEWRKSLGNTRAGDGRRYKGRGIFQLTGRYNYQKYGALIHLDLENNPDLALLPANSLAIACAYWNANDLNYLADADDIEGVTRRINGGLNGLADRKRYLAKIREVAAL